jgi:hypothetical protein
MNTALWSKQPVLQRVDAAYRALMSNIMAKAPVAAMPCVAGQRPLRVVRVAEDQRPPKHTAGRMVISGRMADVCAELDRLIALENQRASFSN